MKYFVMLNLRDSSGITPLVDDQDRVVLFDSEHEAETAADSSMLGYAHGYTVHETYIIRVEPKENKHE